jgi:hypothetical protein
METLDLRKALKPLLSPSPKQPETITAPPMNYLMIDGHGDPNHAPMYTQAVAALYKLAYTIKFAYKKGQGLDYPVMALEGLWWAEDMTRFSVDDKSSWLWTMLIMQPDLVTPSDLERAAAEARRKDDQPLLDQVRLERFEEGLCAQIMHLGPYAAEAPTIEALHGYIAESGHALTGKHHEIYLSDPRRSAPEKMKTIIRQPMTPA